MAAFTENFIIGQNVCLKHEEERILFMLIYILSYLEKFIFTFPELCIIYKYLTN